MALTDSTSDLLIRIELAVRRDPARRGLLSGEDSDLVFPPGRLPQAAQHLAESASQVWIVTGFYIPRADPPAAESDGPLGSLLLASVLRDLGHEVRLLTDPLCFPLLEATARLYDFPTASLRSLASEQIDNLLADSPPSGLTHLISIERVGPSHTLPSFLAQPRTVPPPQEEFERLVPLPSRDRCHNMRGEIIDQHTTPLHRLFDSLPPRSPMLKTIGIGDGGNEIGMGSIPWEQILPRLPLTTPPKSICRVPADWNILAGTSNWGAYALAASVALLRDRVDLLARFTPEQQLASLTQLAADRLAVDGVTREFAPTVDGLPFLTYIQPWVSIRSLLQLD